MKAAVLDLGTNTFNLLIGEKVGREIKVLFEDRQFVMLGKGGISNGFITEDAISRALNTLLEYRAKIEEIGVDAEEVLGTSAIRSAKNGQEVLAEIKARTGFHPKAISGDEEAELIYLGVKSAIHIGDENTLILDIGGGSVEFIFCNKTDLIWKKSIEIGAQRLLDKFHRIDPIPPEEIRNMALFLDEQLKEINQQIALLKPEILIGCAGAFSTFKAIYYEDLGTPELIDQMEMNLPLASFLSIHQEMVSKSKPERLAIPGMLPERVDMIVVASCLVKYLLQHPTFKQLTVSRAALKNGLLARVLEKDN